MHTSRGKLEDLEVDGVLRPRNASTVMHRPTRKRELMSHTVKKFSVTTALIALLSSLLLTVALSSPAEAAGRSTCDSGYGPESAYCTITVKDAPAGASTGLVVATSKYVIASNQRLLIQFRATRTGAWKTLASLRGDGQERVRTLKLKNAKVGFYRAGFLTPASCDGGGPCGLFKKYSKSVQLKKG